MTWEELINQLIYAIIDGSLDPSEKIVAAYPSDQSHLDLHGDIALENDYGGYFIRVF